MTHWNKFLLIHTLLLVFINLTFAQDSLWPHKTNIRQIIALAQCDQWTEIKNNGHLKFTSRWLCFGDTLKTRQIKLEFTTTKNRYQVIQSISDPKYLLQWNDGIRKAVILCDNDTSTITHLIYDIPYPFAQQDLVLKNDIRKDESENFIVSVSSHPDYIETISDVNRQRDYFAEWKILKTKDEKVYVSFTAVSFAKSNIPRWIRDPILQYKLFSSFDILRKLSL